MNFQDPQVDHHSQQKNPKKLKLGCVASKVQFQLAQSQVVICYLQTNYQIPNAHSPYPIYLWPRIHMQVIHQTHQCS